MSYIKFKRGGSYIDSPDWIKVNKTTINLMNKKENKCFEYVISFPLNHKQVKKDPQRTTAI